MSKWDQEFDFDDYAAKPTKKSKEKKKAKKDEDDFFDLEEQNSSKPSKLPVINQRQSKDITNNSKNNKPSKNIYDDYEEIYEEVEEVNSPKKANKKKEVEESRYYEEIEDIQEIKPKNESSVPKKVANTSNYQQEEFYEEIQEIKPPARNQRKVSPKKNIVVEKQPQKKPQPEPEPEYQQNYQQNFDEDYGQDFEEEAPKKSNTTINLKAKDKNVRQSSNKGGGQKKYAINSNQVFTNKNTKDTKTQPTVPRQPQKQNKLQQRNASKKTIEKPPRQIQRSHSRKSIKSNDSRNHIANSRVTKKYNTQFTSNKHVLQVQRAFPDEQNKLSQMNIDRLARVNQHVREMIRKFNDELNELINKNMILLKDKPNQHERKTQDKIRVLQEQLKSGSTALEVIQNEYERLKGREGQLKEEEYLLIMQKKIEQCKQKKRQTAKIIHALQVSVNSQGNKLSKKEEEKRQAQKLHQIKTMLIQSKKQQERNQIKLDKLETMMQDVSGKNSDKEYQLTQQQDVARQKGIILHQNQSLLRRYQETKKKVSQTDKHCKALQGLFKNKGELIGHQNLQIRIAIRNMQSQIKNLYHTLEHSQDQSIKLIKKSKENPKIASYVIQGLDKLLKDIEESQNNNYFDVRSQGNKSQASQRPLKKSMYQNMNKDKSRNNSSRKDKSPTKAKTEQQNDEINLMKPNFMKKKPKNVDISKEEDDETNKLYERVWSQEEETRKGLELKKKEEEEKRKQEQRRRQEEQRKKLEEDKKKPFTLKKNRLKNQEKSFQTSPQKNQDSPPKLQIPAPAPQTKEEQKPSVGPKFTRFSRRAQNKIVIPQDDPIPKEQPKKVEQPIKQQAPKEDEPVFKPKRFNLRNKIEKKDDSYIPTIDKKQQKKQQNEYVPKSVLKDEEVYKIPSVAPKIAEEPKLQIKQDIKVEPSNDEPQIKPTRFSLRRQKKENNDSAGYLPTTKAEPENKVQKNIDSGYNPSRRDPPKQENKISINLTDRNNEPSSNPYAPKQVSASNPYAPKEIPSSNPYAPAPVVQKEEEKPVTNPYAPKEDAPKRQRQGPVKKIKVQKQAPKQKFNIYEQAEDLTEPAVSQAAVAAPIVQPVNQKPAAQNINLAKTDELDLNALLGNNKKKENNDLNDLLVDAKVDKKKQKKKGGNDFFNDLLLD